MEDVVREMQRSGENVRRVWMRCRQGRSRRRVRPHDRLLRMRAARAERANRRAGRSFRVIGTRLEANGGERHRRRELSGDDHEERQDDAAASHARQVVPHREAVTSLQPELFRGAAHTRFSTRTAKTARKTHPVETDPFAWTRRDTTLPLPRMQTNRRRDQLAPELHRRQPRST